MMSPLLYEVVVYSVEALISGIFILNMLHARYIKALQLVLWCEAVFVVMLLTPSFSVARICAIAVIEFVLTLTLYENKLRHKLLFFALKELIMVLSSVVSFGIYSALIKADATFFSSCTDENCTYCLIYLLLFSVFSSICLQFAKGKINIELPWVIGTQLVIGIGEVTSILAIALLSSGTIDSGKEWFAIVALVCMVSANVSIGILAPYLLRKISMINSIDYGTELGSMEYKYYEKSVENEKRLREIKHDISNHIQTIYSLIKNGENQRGLEFIEELKVKYSHIDNLVYCNNPVVNIILSNKKAEAEQYNIETNITVKESFDNIKISDFDLSTVFCNLLDNAIRGCICSEQSHPKLIVEILQKNCYLVIRVLNSCRINMVVDSTDRIDTTKTQGTTHGFGMPVIASIARKHKGDFIASAQNGIFTATVIMSVK